MRRRLLKLLATLTFYSTLNLQLPNVSAQSITFTSPMPTNNDWFGYCVASVGTDRVLIGAYQDNTGAADAGAAYLFSTNGASLMTFTNPAPEGGDYFGQSIAVLGTNCVLIGAPGVSNRVPAAGIAYLFSADGALLTFTNPTPQNNDRFGYSVAAMGSDHLLIAAHQDDTGASDAGAAYLFSANGALLSTFTNPTPSSLDLFGWSVAAMGNNGVLIGALADDAGANAGAAYLFNTNGSLVMTFTNPTPATNDFFGYSVTAVGTDRVLIGAVGDDTIAINAGAAYLFNTNGTLLLTFTPPPLAGSAGFGSSVAAVGIDRVLIGAAGDDTIATNAGAAYLFSTDGSLLMTFRKTTPVIGDVFGNSVAVLGNEWVLIGASKDDTGATDAGAAYLFNLPAQTPRAPGLTIRLTPTNTVAVSWLSPSTGWTLQENTSGVASVNWSNAPGTTQDDGTNKTLIVPPMGERFYRLFKP